MAYFGGQRNNSARISHLDPQVLNFSVFTTEELEKLAVKKIHSPLTFDNFGHPFPGGLYDKALGPYSNKSEPCGTCFQNVNFCPGHFGYIELPLPVINAMFFKFITDILRLACFNCFHLQIPTHIKTCLSIQMKLINCGLITEAMNMQDQLQDIMSGESELSIPEEVNILMKSYKKLIKKTDPVIIFNQNIQRIKSKLLDHNYLRELSRKAKSCLYCKHPKGVFKTLKNKIFAPVQDLGSKSVKASTTRILTPQETRQYLRNIWENDSKLLQDLAPILANTTCEWPTDLCFFSIIPVTPPLVRPINFVAGRILENEQTQVYREIMETCILLRYIIGVVKNNDDINILPAEAQGMYNSLQGSSAVEKLNIMWEILQRKVDFLIDKEKNIRSTGGQGLKQILEKKQGLIRMHMMGKRVNFSARSVITPDPYLNIEEIGVPDAFAKKLSYPTPVNHLNITEMRQMVINGPNVHPGAVYVEYENGFITKLSENDIRQRESIANILLTPEEKGFNGVKKVHRHLCNGDVVLLNRQPTLHRPSIMAHIVRILKNEKTLRLHYANCKAYNADFDGDEMNVHFPQNDVGRSEGYNLAQVSYQYLSPKDGTPLSGLIQDHVIAGVHLSLRGKFFNKESYQQLVFQGLPYKTSEIKLLPPAIIKPVTLWSGKQVLSTLIINLLPEEKHLINLTSSAKISSKAWNKLPAKSWLGGGINFTSENEMSETEVIIRKGQLLVGVLDKAQYGATAYGLIHCVYELYGGKYAAKLLSSFSKLFTYYLQREGFTLSVNDILVLKKADKKRDQIINECRKAGKTAISAALNVSEDVSIDEIVDKLQEASFRNDKMRSIIDGKYKQSLDKLTNEINKTCLPAGLICGFPKNNLQLMVQSGAKGSTVNTMQISCLLGQIELEGKRPPLMISGKSLPSFPIFEFSPRAGGFIDGRFMTGIQPPEFFFHCMAGREGLIDTAVKTSRSGYLQRCLVKLLEGIKVCYDMTVRDSDGSIIQFLYGEDGMDVTKLQFLNKKHLKFLIENADTIRNEETIKILKEDHNYKKVDSYIKELNAWKSEFGDPLHKKRETPFKMFSEVIKPKLNINEEESNKINPKTGRVKSSSKIQKLWRSASDDIKKQFDLNCKRCPDPVNANLKPDVYFGSLTDKLYQLMNEQNPYENKSDRKKYENMFKLKAMESLCPPGEAVGLLAAQSIGEPSTQMTLNTFHFAGRGDMNVTLGIPRIREILMEASKTLKTPAMEIPFLNIPNIEKKAEKLRKFLTRVTVSDVLVNIEVDGNLEIRPFRQWCYTLKFNFLPHHLYKSKYDVKPKKIVKHMQTKFVKSLFSYMKSQLRIQTSRVTSYKKQEKEKSNDDDEEEKSTKKEKPKNDEESEDEGEDNTEDAKMTHKYEEEHEKEEEIEKDESESDEDENENDKQEALDESGFKTSQNSYSTTQNYDYDQENYRWCTIDFSVPVSQKKLDFSAILREVTKSSVISETPGINKAIVYEKDGRLTLRTDGCNIPEMFKYDHLLDLNKLYSNDIHKIAEIYGIEAANKVVTKEVKEVFGPYSITVDDRHLTLVADCMTCSGTFKPLNRMGIASCASPLQQVSFESSLRFLREAIVTGKMDQLKSPSSCLVTGKPCQVGTGSFNLLNKLPV